MKARRHGSSFTPAKLDLDLSVVVYTKFRYIAKSNLMPGFEVGAALKGEGTFLE